MIIASIGDTGFDYYINRGIRRVGGIAFNYAVKSNPVENSVYLLSPIGTLESELILKEVAEVNILSDYIQLIEGRSPEQRIELQNDGKRIFCGYDKGILPGYRLTEDSLDFLETADIIHSPLTDGFESVFNTICGLRTQGLKTADISIDYEYYKESLVEEYIDHFDIIFLGGNLDHMPVIERLAERHSTTILVLTMGEHGSALFSKKQRWIQPAATARIVDSTGCGDTFQAVFSLNYLRHGDIALSLSEASQAASETLSHIGILKKD